MSAPAAPATPCREDCLELLECARYGELEDVAALLLEGVPVDFADDNGVTALFKAAANGHKDVASLLIEKGARFTSNASGSTPLHWAALNGQKDMVDLLLAKFDTLDVLAKNSFGKSALTEALNAGHEDIGRALLGHTSADPALYKGREEGDDEIGEGDMHITEEETDSDFEEEGEGGEREAAGAGDSGAPSEAGAGAS